MGESEILIFIITAIVIMLALVGSLLIFFNFSQKKIIAEQEKNHFQKMKFQKEMLAIAINTQEEERSRIARELHDDISSKLNIINVNMNFLKMKITDIDLQSSMANISFALKESIERSRNISHELMPPILEKFGLDVSLNDLMNQINELGTVKIELGELDNFKTITRQNKLHVFRIIQELCNNTLKHAAAQNIYISSEITNETFVFTYEDDGVGMIETSNSKGIGTMNIESRVQILGGAWENISTPKGVSFKFTLPNAKQENNNS